MFCCVGDYIPSIEGSQFTIILTHFFYLEDFYIFTYNKSLTTCFILPWNFQNDVENHFKTKASLILFVSLTDFSAPLSLAFKLEYFVLLGQVKKGLKP